jgi:predicted nucleic acid-binding protein
LPIVDASAAVEYLVGTPLGARVAEVLASRGDVGAPHVFDFEVVSGLRRLAAHGGLDPGIALEALRDLAELPVERYPAQALLARMWELRHTHTAPDAAYVALAELLETPLLTADVRLARSHGHGAQIELVEL